jgi:uncharacterized damage-inducible protein DinB
MSAADQLLPEFDQEMATTRRLLERVPTDKGTWKPHEKSFPLGHLTQLISMMPSWIARTLREESINLGGGPGYSFETTETLLAQFDKGVSDARAAIAESSDDHLGSMWSLKMGDCVLYSQKRGDAIRNHISHLIHHRGQLSVYLRMVDVPIPSIYGPTADEPWKM